MIIAASGTVGPSLRPYEQSGQIAALLSGYPDALAYEQILGQMDQASRQQNAQTWSHLLLVALIIALIIRSTRGWPELQERISREILRLIEQE